MKDYLVKGLAYNGEVRIYAAHTTNLVEQARQSHDLWPVPAAALGRTLTASSIMGTMLKGEESLSVEIFGAGLLGKIITHANNKGEVIGYVTNNHVHTESVVSGKLNVGGAVGKHGFLTVRKDLGMREPWSGSVPLVSGEIGEDFTYYFAVSEQTPSAVSVGVLVNPDNSVVAAGGFIIQMMPDASEETIVALEEALKGFPHISTLIKDGKSPEEIISMLVGEEYQLLETVELSYTCDCSKKRFAEGIKKLGNDSIDDLLNDQEPVETTCHFCGQKYYFTHDEIRELKSHE